MKNFMMMFVVCIAILFNGCATKTEVRHLKNLVKSHNEKIVKLNGEIHNVSKTLDLALNPSPTPTPSTPLTKWEKLLGKEVATKMEVKATYSSSLFDLVSLCNFQVLEVAVKKAAKENHNFEVTEVAPNENRIRVWHFMPAK